MSGSVVADGSEPPRGTSGSLPLLWVGLAVLAGFMGFVFLSRGQQSAVVTPDTTLPELNDHLGWKPVPLPGSEPLTAVDRTTDGFVAAGPGPQFWRVTEGGSEWERGRYMWSRPDVVSGIASFGDGAVAVGADTVDGTRSVAAAWASDDGRSWEEVPLSVGEDSALEGVVEFNGRLFAWGWTGRPEDFTPEAGPLLLTSVDGREWRSVSVVDDGTRIQAVVRAAGEWLVMGSSDGRPALWSSTNAETWERIPTDSLPFGWTMVDAYDDGALTVNVRDSGYPRTRRWRLLEDGSWRGMGSPVPGGPERLERGLDRLSGVGSGRLWEVDGEWAEVPLDGQVTAATGRVAVGSHGGQPAAWVNDPSRPPETSVILAPGDQWVIVDDLGEGTQVGPFPVAGGWIVGVGERWWRLDEGGIRPVDDLAGATVAGVDRIGDEWVAYPAMRWSAGGGEWEQRAEPWPGVGEGDAQVQAVTSLDDDTVLAVGMTSEGRPSAARSVDAGRSWYAVPPLIPVLAHDVHAVPGGFVAVAVQARNRRQSLAIGGNGDRTVPLEGELIRGIGIPALLTPGGEITFPEGGGFSPPRLDIDTLAHTADGVVALTSGTRLWVGPGTWEEIPMDPAHGLPDTLLHPMPVGDRILAVGSDRGRVRIREWAS